MSTTRPPPNAPAKRLSWDEMQKRREKGLCFGCNEKFVPGHHCQTPQVFLIEVLPQGLGDMDGFDEELGGAGDGHSEESPLISLHALAGCSGPRTMRVKAVIGKRALVVLIDSGSTHNFVDQKLAHDLHMAVTPIDAFTVKVANGERLICRERYDHVTIITIQQFTFTATLFALPLKELDLVLGIQWLEKLGPVICDWKQMSMEFKWGPVTRDFCPFDGTHS